MNKPLEISVPDELLAASDTTSDEPTPMLQAVMQHLAELGWSYDTDVKGERTLIRTKVSLDNILVKTVFEIEESRDRFGVFVYAPLHIPESRRLEVMAYLTRANHRVYLSKFEFDMGDGELRVVSTARTEDATLSVQMVARMRRDVHRVMDKYIPGVLGIVYGDQTADQAWEVLKAGEAAELAEDTKTGTATSQDGAAE